VTKDIHFRVCKDRSGDELSKLGFSYGMVALDKRMAIQVACQMDIKYAFGLRKKYAISRYGDGTWPVLYTAKETETAIHEVAYHSRREWKLKKKLSGRKLARKLIYSLSLNAKNVTVPIVTKSLINPVRYKYCQSVARSARLSGSEALIVPSVRKSGGFCVPVFSASCIKLNLGVETVFTVIWDVASDYLSHTVNRRPEPILLLNK
jgi:hypothetical protein